jgi:three-Cys-motif partner protein
MSDNWGGKWTVRKKAAVSAYLNIFQNALKNQTFHKWYIDAFAGTGYHTYRPAAEPSLFSEKDIAEVKELRIGSATLALESAIPFDKYIFIEKDPVSFETLTSLSKQYPEKPIFFQNSDANDEIVKICKVIKTSSRRPRCVLFLDPFGMQLTWNTLEAISTTGVCDIWYLFPTNAVNRMLPNDGKIPSSWESRLNLLFGTPEWKTTFYTQIEQGSLFDSKVDELIKYSSFNKIEEYTYSRLSSIFPYVSPKPLSLYNSRNLLFSLFFAVSNTSPKARALANRIFRYIELKNKEH